MSVTGSTAFDQTTDWVAYHARRSPDRIALDGIDTGLTLTWAALDGRVARLSGALAGRFGVRPGDRVALMADDDPRVIELQLACFRIGALFVPLNWRLAVAELETLCRDAQPVLLAHDAAWQHVAVTLADRVAIPALASWDCPDSLADIEAARDGADRLVASPFRSGGQTGQILYTSGTTGLPKGVMVPLRSLAANTLNIFHGISLGPSRRYLSAVPLFHAAGLNVLANPVMIAGGRLSIVKRFDPQRVAGLLGDPANGFTHFNAVPAMYQMLADTGLGGGDFSGLIGAQAGAGTVESALSDHLAEHGIEVQTSWGSTEMGPVLTLLPRPDRVQKNHTVGFPVQHTQLRIVDADTGIDVEPGTVGEAWARGASVCTQYWRREPADDDATREGWFRSGDAISVDEDGFVLYRGRFKDMYKSGGENVYAAEVENVLITHAGVAEVAVIGVPDTRWGEVGCAVIVPAAGAAVELNDLVEHCAGRLARYKVPKSVVTVESLPRNALGKVQKDRLRTLSREVSRLH
jgi:fatty-acyl-CoA synthase